MYKVRVNGMGKKKEQTKYLEAIILVIIVAAIGVVIVLAKTFVKGNIKLSNSEEEIYSINKVHRYQNVLNDISHYDVPFMRYIDVANSYYEVTIKSTDNFVTEITEEIKLQYFDLNVYTVEQMDQMNVATIGRDYFLEYLPSSGNESTENNALDELNQDEQPVDDGQTEIPGDAPVQSEVNPEVLDGNDVVVEGSYDKNDGAEKEPVLPLPYIDIYNLPIENFNDDILTNYCNAYNDIDSFYTLQCSRKKNMLNITNRFVLSNIGGYVVKTKKFEITLPVKRDTRLSDYIKELQDKEVEIKEVKNIK